jgi:GTPase
MVERERALLVQAILGRRDPAEAEDSLAELERLADTAGAAVAGHVTQRRACAHPGFYIGEGKLADVQLACRQSQANLVIFDNDLSPVQVNNLDRSLGVKVIDRTELILQIFARRARSAEAQIQVELAQLQYLISRIPATAAQQRFQGGIGMRGPGESPLRLRNEPMRRRIRELKRRLEQVQDRRARTRTRRTWPQVALVGYTNAGKSTLLNAFTATGAYVDDLLFATLDTKTRRLGLGGQHAVLLTDTVGFIRHLPHGLVASFRSTLDVAAASDLLLVVAEAGHPRLDDHLQVVSETLREIGADRVPRLLLLNKCDVLDEAAEAACRQRYPAATLISATHKIGLEEVKQAVACACCSGE